jgi:hypothetical protein
MTNRIEIIEVKIDDTSYQFSNMLNARSFILEQNYDGIIWVTLTWANKNRDQVELDLYSNQLIDSSLILIVEDLLYKIAFIPSFTEGLPPSKRKEYIQTSKTLLEFIHQEYP